MCASFAMVHGGHSTDAIMGDWRNNSFLIPNGLLISCFILLAKHKDYIHSSLLHWGRPIAVLLYETSFHSNCWSRCNYT